MTLISYRLLGITIRRHVEARREYTSEHDRWFLGDASWAERGQETDDGDAEDVEGGGR